MTPSGGVGRRAPHGPQISWHRGGGELAPSATLAAFVAAAAAGAEVIEVDVRATADGVLVCVHDPELPGLGAIAELDLMQLAQLPEDLCTLEQFLSGLDGVDPDAATGVHLDLKSEGDERAAVAALRARNRPFFVTTPSVASIRTLRSLDPTLEAYLTIGTSREGRSLLGRAALLGRELLPFADLRSSGATGVAVHERLCTALLQHACAARGLGICVWTVDRDDALRRWLRSGVDVVTTNRPQRALELRAELDAT